KHPSRSKRRAGFPVESACLPFVSASPGAVHELVGFTLGFFLAFGLAAVVKLLTLGHREFTLCNSVPEINFQRDNGQAFLLGLNEQAVDFAAVQKQLTLPEWVMISQTARQIFGDVAVDEPSLAKLDLRVSVAERT